MAHDAAPTRASAGSRPRVYLAGPDIFFRDSATIYDTLKAHCARHALEGVEPSDGGVRDGFSGSDDAQALRIYQGNVALIREADGVIANLMDFRGLEPDSGTVFEVGFAVALGKPVVVYGVPDGSYANRVCQQLDCVADASGALRERESGVMVEGLGQPLNLMLACSTTIAATAEEAVARLALILSPATRSATSHRSSTMPPPAR